MSHSIRRGAAIAPGLAVALLGVAQLFLAPASADIVSGRPDKPHGDSWRIEMPGGVRTALVIPAVNTRAPTVIVLHGAVNSAGWAMRRFGFAEAAAARGLAAAFPQAVGSHWNDGRRSDRADDVAFLRRLAAELVERGVATPKRIYIAGISGGGMMALRMVCESADLIAGAGTVIASMPTATGDGCRPKRPVPIVMFNGSADWMVPYRGGRVSPFARGGRVWGAEETAAFLAEANRCRRGPVDRDALIGRASVTRMAWSDCAGGAGVTLYRVNGGRHQVPGRNRLLPGAPKDELSAEATILDGLVRGE